MVNRPTTSASGAEPATLPPHEEALSCPLCGAVLNGQFRMPYIDIDFTHLPAAQNPFTELENVVCDSCGFGWAVPFLPEERILAFYEAAYRENSVYSGEVQTSLAALMPFNAKAAAQLLLARMFRHFRVGEAALEIGPGYGESFYVMSQLFPGLRQVASEPDQGAARWLNQRLGVEVIPDAFSGKVKLREVMGGRRFDLVLMSHVLEHFRGGEVVAVLENVRHLLADGGMLVCEVPACDLRRDGAHRKKDSPHLSFFSAESLRLTMVRAGLTVKFLDTCGRTVEAWQASSSGQDQASAGKARSAPSYPVGVAKRVFRAMRGGLPRRLGARLDALLLPFRIEAVLQHDESSYGGARTFLRAVAVKE